MYSSSKISLYSIHQLRKFIVSKEIVHFFAMSNTGENVSAKSGRKIKNNISWTDEETALLLQVIIDYKSSKAALGLVWETVKSKYDDICERMESRYPREKTEFDPEEYPNYSDPSVFTTKM